MSIAPTLLNEHAEDERTNTGLQTNVDGIADGIFRLSGITEHGFTFNQFLLTGEQPFLFHCGMGQLYPLDPCRESASSDSFLE